MVKINFGCDNVTYCENWKYRGEGNAHLAISLPDLRKVLVIRKQITINNGKSQKEAPTSFLNSIAFQNQIMKALFGNYVSEIHQVEFLDDLHCFAQELDQLRPAHRMHKTITQEAVLCQDYAFFDDQLNRFSLGDVYAIEIKPKFGVASEENCIFCQKQILKLRQGDIKRTTNYCPKKLFSGDSKMMEEAIEDLIQNPQNNFQIFKNGNLKYSDNHQLESFDSFLNETFLSGENFKMSLCGMLSRDLEEFQESKEISDGLPKGCVLEKILKYQTYYLTDTDSSPDNFDYVEKCLVDFNSNCLDLETYKSKSPAVCKVLGKIVKDCSVMVTFMRTNKSAPRRNLIQCQNGRKFLFDVKIFDLYPK